MSCSFFGNTKMCCRLLEKILAQAQLPTPNYWPQRAWQGRWGLIYLQRPGFV